MRDILILISQIAVWGVVALFVVVFVYVLFRVAGIGWFKSKEDYKFRLRPYDFGFDENPPREEEENRRG